VEDFFGDLHDHLVVVDLGEGVDDRGCQVHSLVDAAVDDGAESFAQADAGGRGLVVVGREE
jgi:hypothetical protein